MSKHTPGPWKTQSAGVGFRRPTERSGDLAIVGSTGICPGIVWMADGGEREGIYEEMKANAALIAAAPDLLEACKAALWMIGTDADRKRLGEEMFTKNGVKAIELPMKLAAAIRLAEGQKPNEEQPNA